MNQLLALFKARNKEYYRDRGSLSWSFIMPPLIIAVIALAFSRSEPPIFKVGVYSQAQLPSVIEQANYIQKIPFENLELAQQKVRHHQLDLLLLSDPKPSYFYNAESQSSKVLQDLIEANNSSVWSGEAISGRKVRYVDWVIPGVLAMNLMFSGLYGVGYVIVRYRKNGVLKRLQATPVSPLKFLSAQILSRLMIMLAVSCTVYIACDLFLDFLMLGSYLTLFMIAIIGNLCLLSLGLIVASRTANEELANGLLNFLVFPMMLLSEVWFSLDGAPAWMSTAAQFLPLTHMIQAARSVMIDGATLAQVSHHLIIMLVMTVIFLAVSLKIFKWRAV